MIPSYFQTDAWGKFKAATGWRASRYGNLLGLERGLALGKSMLYFPEIPFSDESLATVKKIIRDNGGKRHIFTRFEFLTPWSAPAAQTLVELGLVKSFEEVQPEHRQWVPLEGSEEDILKQMKPKGRYNVGVAERNNLVVKTGMTNELLADFYDLYAETARRSKFSGRSASYFQGLCNLLVQNNQGEIVAVYQGKKALAAGIILYYGTLASYLYGGSVRQPAEQSLMAPYLMHWEAMKQAKKRGCKIYDLLAISPPADASAEAAFNHPYAGLSRFKSQFGGSAVHLLGSWDLVGNSLWYTLYQLAERRRRKIAR